MGRWSSHRPGGGEPQTPLSSTAGATSISSVFGSECCNATTELRIISAAVEIESIMLNDLTQVECVDGEEGGPKNRTLRPTLVGRGRGEGNE